MLSFVYASARLVLFFSVMLCNFTYRLSLYWPAFSVSSFMFVFLFLLFLYLYRLASSCSFLLACLQFVYQFILFHFLFPSLWPRPTCVDLWCLFCMQQYTRLRFVVSLCNSIADCASSFLLLFIMRQYSRLRFVFSLCSSIAYCASSFLTALFLYATCRLGLLVFYERRSVLPCRLPSYFSVM